MVLVRAAAGAAPAMESLLVAGRPLWVGEADYPVLRFTHTLEAGHRRPTQPTQSSQLHEAAMGTRPFAAARTTTFELVVERATLRNDGTTVA